MSLLRVLFWPVCFMFVFSSSANGGKPTIELTVGDRVYAGRAVVHDASSCWLLRNDGRLDQLDLEEISNFRKLNATFKSTPAVELRSQLQKEMGRDIEVVSTEHYLICAPRGVSRVYADLFEKTYRTCRHYFQVRGLKVNDLEFPLVAIVFPSREQFAEYMRNEGITYSNGILGYYSPTTNRTALYQHDQLSAVDAPSSTGDVARLDITRPFITSNETQRRSFADPSIYFSRGTDDGSVFDTIVHEGTHQVAFNIGVHCRWGQNPRWVVEGLATVFEAPGIHERSSKVTERLNRERFAWYVNALNRRKTKLSLSDFVASDSSFATATLDAYAQAWALTFYLLETRSAQYSRYLKRLAERSPLEPLSPNDRLEDFRAEFGKDIDWLGVEMERYFTRLK